MLASCWYLQELFLIPLQHYLDFGRGFCMFRFQRGWREHKLPPNWRNRFSFPKSDRLSFIAYWLHREIIIALLLSVKRTITEDNALSQERRQTSSSPDHSSLPRLQAGLSPKAPFATWPAQSERQGVKRVWVFLDTRPTSREKMRECSQTFSRGSPHQREELAEPAALVPPARGVTICLAATHAANSPWNEAPNLFRLLLLALTDIQPFQASAKL